MNCGAKMSRFEGKPLMKRVEMCNGPFLSHPQFYTPPISISDSTHSGRVKRSFSILQQDAGMLIFTYDDSDEFRATFQHYFDLSAVKFLGWSPLASSFLCVREKVLYLMMLTEPSFKKVELSPIVHKEISGSGFSPQGNFIYLLLILSCETDRYKLEFREAETGKIRKTASLTWNWGMQLVYISDVLKWAFDESYVALLAGGVVHVFETKTFTCSKRFETIQNFGWSPSALTLALFGDRTVKISEISNGGVSDMSGLEGVSSYKPVWHSTGHYLACICRGIGVNKILVVSLKSGMSEYITPPPGDNINLAWKENGNEFVISSGSNDRQHYEICFYTIQENGESLSQKTKTLEGIEADSLHWSPNGSYMVFEGREMLCFYDVQNHQQLASVHYIADFVEWDPSSRFFLTQASTRHLFNDKALRIWSARGEKLINVGTSDLIMTWCHKQSCATENSMLIDAAADGGGGLAGDSSVVGMVNLLLKSDQGTPLLNLQVKCQGWANGFEI